MSQPNVEFTAPSEPPPLYDRRSLPAGWVKEHDPQVRQLAETLRAWRSSNAGPDPNSV